MSGIVTASKSGYCIEVKEWLDQIFGGKPTTLLRFAETFENAGSLLEPYADEAIDNAFWKQDEALRGLLDESIEWSLRKRLVRSFVPLFQQLFATRCKPALGHLDEDGSPLNSSCYMWFDLDCWSPIHEPVMAPELEDLFLASMQSILEINQVSCQESALAPPTPHESRNHHRRIPPLRKSHPPGTAYLRPTRPRRRCSITPCVSVGVTTPTTHTASEHSPAAPSSPTHSPEPAKSPRRSTSPSAPAPTPPGQSYWRYKPTLPTRFLYQTDKHP